MIYLLFKLVKMSKKKFEKLHFVMKSLQSEQFSSKDYKVTFLKFNMTTGNFNIPKIHKIDLIIGFNLQGNFFYRMRLQLKYLKNFIKFNTKWAFWSVEIKLN